VIRAFRAAEREVGAAFARLEADLSATPTCCGVWACAPAPATPCAAWSRRIEGDGVTAKVTLSLGEGLSLHASITRRSVEDLGLAPGRAAIALIKSSFVRLDERDGDNRLAGEIVDREAGDASAEVTIAWRPARR
jgi:molybdate transport system regulatory protein